MNFINSSVFRHKTENAKLPAHSACPGLLAVWGSPGCGKSITATKIAKALADQKKNVVLLFCDMAAPMLPCVCPASEVEHESSLGSILAAPGVSEALVKNNITTLKKNGYLTMLGMRKGENEYTYPQYTQQQAKQLFSCLRAIAPYVIVDCSSYIGSNVLSAVALMEADNVLRLTGCELKAVSFFSGQLALMRDTEWDTDKHYLTASDVKPNQPAAQIGNCVFTLPHSQELEEQYLAGNLLAELSLKDSRVFRKEIRKITKEVFGI